MTDKHSSADSAKPVAWLYEMWCGEGCWTQRYSDTKPAGNSWERNIRPLYLGAPLRVEERATKSAPVFCASHNSGERLPAVMPQEPGLIPPPQAARDADVWKNQFYAALKLLHEALDVIEDIDSECLLPPQLKDMVDAVLAPRRGIPAPEKPLPDAPEEVQEYSPGREYRQKFIDRAKAFVERNSARYGDKVGHTDDAKLMIDMIALVNSLDAALQLNYSLSQSQAESVPQAVPEPLIPLADHDEICRLLQCQPWEVQQAIVTIAAHCLALTDEQRTEKVADLAGCISHCCQELALALSRPDREGK